jgi:CO/xanthine dehydrogenase FAD-binding subunit
MIPAAFEYQKAKTVDEALTALSNGEAKLLAGVMNGRTK